LGGGGCSKPRITETTDTESADPSVFNSFKSQPEDGYK